MSKLFVIPDVHGRDFWQVASEYVNHVDQVIFLGDYLDPYPRENITKEVAYDNFLDIISFKHLYRDDVTLLLGNHDLHYLPQFKYNWGCRRDDANFDKISDVFIGNLKHFKISYVCDKYLFTHAGVLQGWLDVINGIKKVRTTIPIDGKKQYTISNLNDIIIDNPNLLMMISEERGGRDIYGSCVWADVFEHLYSNWEPPIPDIYQVFGHTMTYPSVKDAYIGSNFAMLDSQSCYLIDDGEFIKI